MKLYLENNNSAIYWHRRSGKNPEVVNVFPADERRDGIAILVQGLQGTVAQIEPGDLILNPRSGKVWEVWPQFLEDRAESVFFELVASGDDFSFYVYGRELK